MQRVHRILASLTFVAFAATLGGCASEGGLLDTKAKKGAVIGTLAGAAAGAAIGGKKHRAGGALIGAAGGALAGGLIGNYLDKQAQELDQIPGAEVERRDDSLLVNFEGGILFDTNSTSLSPGGYDRLRSMAATLNNYPKSRVIIKGHTDSQGDERYNQKLSEERANTVRGALAAEGVASSRLSSMGMGEKFPLASNDTAEGRQQNRRVEIEIRPNEEVMQSGEAQ
jgi:outer membrane protein OmpA-like peptidoglycan-associated protein